MTEPVKKPKAKRAPRPSAKAASVKPKKVSAPSRSKKSSPSKTEDDGATSVAILVQEINELKKEVTALHNELIQVKQQCSPRAVFEVMRQLSTACVNAYEPKLLIKEIGVDGELENEATHTIYVNGDEFVVGILKDDRVSVFFDSTTSDASPKRIATFKEFLATANVVDGEVKANIYEVQ